MGCDIHASIEAQKYEDLDWWGEVENIQIDRWYELFARLAGVRQSVPEFEVISEPKGFPNNASYETTDFYERWGPDAHTPSYLTFYEIKKLPEKFHNELFYKVMQILAEKYGEHSVRVIFWFDN